MEYDKFIQCIKRTKWIYAKGTFPQEAKYEKLRARGDDYWLHLERKSEYELGKEVITGFLNKWQCRLDEPETERGKQLKCNLKKAVGQLSEYYAGLKGFKLENMQFGKDNLFLIDCIYSVFRQIKPKFGAVPASKLMHMALPDLFMMWDDGIIGEYGVKKQVLPYFERRVWSYTSFLILMQENISHMKETCPGGSVMSNQKLLQQINRQCGEKDLSITRLLDMANYAISREKVTYQKCHKCIESTKSRMEALEWYDGRAKTKKPFFD